MILAAVILVAYTSAFAVAWWAVKQDKRIREAFRKLAGADDDVAGSKDGRFMDDLRTRISDAVLWLGGFCRGDANEIADAVIRELKPEKPVEPRKPDFKLAYNFALAKYRSQKRAWKELFDE